METASERTWSARIAGIALVVLAVASMLLTRRTEHGPEKAAVVTAGSAGELLTEEAPPDARSPVTAPVHREPVPAPLAVLVRLHDHAAGGVEVWLLAAGKATSRVIDLPTEAAVGTTDDRGLCHVPEVASPSMVWAGSRALGYGCVQVTPGQTQATVDIPTGSLQFRALSLTGQAVANVGIAASTAQVPYGGPAHSGSSARRAVAHPVRGIHRSTTDARGLAEIKGLLPGRYFLTLEGAALPHSKLPTFVDVASAPVELQAQVVFPLASLTGVVGDDVVTIERRLPATAVSAGEAASELARLTRWLRNQWQCQVHVIAAESPQTMHAEAVAVCRRSGRFEFTETYHPATDAAEPRLLDASHRPTVHDWPLVALRLSSDGLELPGGAWMAGARDPSLGALTASGTFGEPAPMAPGTYQINTMLREAADATRRQRATIAPTSREVVFDVGPGKRMCQFEFVLACGGHPRFVAWTLSKEPEWHDSGFTEGTEALHVIAPHGRLSLFVRCFGCKDLTIPLDVDAALGLNRFRIEIP
jgi:hypothetical protein